MVEREKRNMLRKQNCNISPIVVSVDSLVHIGLTYNTLPMHLLQKEQNGTCTVRTRVGQDDTYMGYTGEQKEHKNIRQAQEH